jgi:hypothetical protein
MKVAVGALTLLSCFARNGQRPAAAGPQTGILPILRKQRPPREWCHDHPTEVDAALRASDQTCIHVEQAYVRQLERQAPR